MSPQPESPQWFCAQIGAREHYAIPRALRQSGKLTALCTDFWAGPLTRRLAEQSINEFELREGQIYDMVIRQVEKSLIEKALTRCSGVKIKAADFLGINRNTLNKKFKELGLEIEDGAPPAGTTIRYPTLAIDSMMEVREIQ